MLTAKNGRLTLLLALLLFGASTLPAQASGPQQVVERGALGVPDRFLDGAGGWTAPLLLASDPEEQTYMPDVSNPAWLGRNYNDYEGRGKYTLTVLTLYRTPAACRKDQIAWGYADAAHLSACETDIGYRIRRLRIQPSQQSVELLMAAMVDHDGFIEPGSVQDQRAFQSWDRLSATTQAALEKANGLVSRQMNRYARRLERAQ